MLVSSSHFSAPLHQILQSLGPQLLIGTGTSVVVGGVVGICVVPVVDDVVGVVLLVLVLLVLNSQFLHLIAFLSLWLSSC